MKVALLSILKHTWSCSISMFFFSTMGLQFTINTYHTAMLALPRSETRCQGNAFNFVK